MKKNSLSKFKLHVKCGDVVQLIAGKEKGKLGVVTKLLKKKSKIIVSDINIKYKNFKGNKSYQKGEIKQLEFPIHSSNVIKWDK